MLEIRNLSKVYRSKTGEEVRALDNVSIAFPESGMVFILGKSGSGKSTLLNIMGGLDSYDSGEFIIKGKSSKDFAGSDFDAYRNTFIGFIFQEYNVLDDFSVGANIGLALELQGKKATDEKINQILSQVDLVSYAKRKPNELSGGQKQRVAIARALVKEPQIIMADEPTGALDSNTGKQIFDALKELSREKLVLIVSHDRDFAERYADRIIELSDGRIISDVTKHERHSVQLSEGIQQINSKILRIKGGYRLTESDLKMINDYLSKNEHDIILSGDGRINDELRSAAGISAEGNTSVFEGTDAAKDYTLKSYKKEDSRFIHSRLPIKNALKMGTSGLKHKKFRLVMTIFLSLIAFALFGFANTLASYNKLNATVDSLMDSNVKNASVTVSVRRTINYADGDSYTSFERALMNEQDIEKLRDETGLSFVPVFTGGDRYGGRGGFALNSMMQSYDDSSEVYTGRLAGLVSMSESDLSTAGLSITGRLPENEGEIAITDLVYRQFNEFGFRNTEFDESVAAGALTKDEGSANSILGKHITLPVESNGPMAVKGPSFVIVGVIDTQFDYERYADFLPKEETNTPAIEEEGNALSEMVLGMEIQSELNYGFHALGFMLEKDIETIAASSMARYEELATPMNGWNSQMYIMLSAEAEDGEGEAFQNQINQVADSSAISKLDITWLDGVERTALAPNEVIIPSSAFNMLRKQETTITVDGALVRDFAIELYGEEKWNATDPEMNYMERFYEAARPDPIPGQEYPPEIDYRAVEESVLPLVQTLLGIEIPEGIPIEELSSLFEILRSTGENHPDYTLQQHSLVGYLRTIYGYQDFVEGSLWENETLINLMFEANYSELTPQKWNEMDEEQQKFYVSYFYREFYLSNSDQGYETNAFGEYSGKEIEDMAKTVFANLSDFSVEDIIPLIKLEKMEENYENGQTISLGLYDLKIVGYYDSDKTFYGNFLISDTIMADYRVWAEENMGDYGYTETCAEHDDGIWAFALAPMGRDQNAIETLVSLSYDESGDLHFELHNPVVDTLSTFNEFIEIGSLVFLYVGIGFAVFSALLLMNFISTSISYKKREIGVLRAVGARSSDVFKIFFSEALVIALINFILSTVAVVAAIIVTNTLMHNSGINVTLLRYGPTQFILMLAVSVGVALLASFLPVYNIARRKPIDAIRDR